MKRLYVFYGEDDLSAKEALAAVKAEVGPPDAVQSSLTLLDGRGLPFGQLEMACNTIPFFGERRLVVVEGLLERFEQRQSGAARRPAGKAAAKGGLEEEWGRLPALVQGMPPSTSLVLLSRTVGAQNPVLRSLESLGDVRAFPVRKGPELQAWIRERVEKHGGRITPGAVRLLETYAGEDPRRLDNEIAKLCTHANGRLVAEEAVNAMTNDAREASIFALVDAVMEGRNTLALKTLGQLMDQGASGPYVTTMLARQTRMLLTAKSLKEAGGSPADLPPLLGTNSDYVVRKVVDQARPYSLAQLKRLHEMVLDADVAMKDGTSTEDLALESLVVEAAAMLK